MSGELRLDPMTGQWVNIVAHRQHRPNLPAGGCPFCVGGLEAPELYDTRWFTNRWSAYEPGDALDLAAAVGSGTTTLPATGAAEVILYSPRHVGSLASLGVGQIRKVIDLWAARTEALMARAEIEYVLVFESRGPEVGATIHHPHGQIYGYPFVPPAAVTEQHTLANEIAMELADGRRIVFDDGEWVAWVPFASGYPYGLRVAPRTHVERLDELSPTMRDGLAAAMADVLGRYDRLWSGEPNASEIFPYLMWFHQAPKRSDGEYHLHLHLAPPQRSPGVARYLAAGEVGSGMLSNPVIPEDAAAALRAL